MWGGRALSMDMSQKSGMPREGKGTAEEVEVCRVQGEEPCHKRLRQLLEVEGTRSKEEVERAEGEASRRGKSSEAYNATSERSLDEDEDRNGEDQHP